MKSWLWAALLAIMAAVPHPAAAQGDALPARATPTAVRIGTLASDPPFEYSSSGGEPKGMEIELGQKYCALAKLTCRW